MNLLSEAVFDRVEDFMRGPKLTPLSDTRAAIVLWTRPPAKKLAENSNRLGDQVDCRRWNDEVASLADALGGESSRRPGSSRERRT